MDAVDSLSSKAQTPEEGRTPSIGESDSDDEFFDALAAGDANNDNNDGTATGENTQCKEKEKQHTTTDDSLTRIVDDLIQSKIGGGETVDATNQDPRGGADDTSNDGSHGSPSENEQPDKEPSEHEGVYPNRIQETSEPFSDTAIHEGLRAEQEEDNLRSENDEDNGRGVVIDEEAMRELEEQMTEEEKQARRAEAQTHKTRGNELFKSEEYADAVYEYGQALQLCPLCFKKDRSIMYANRAACRVRQEDFENAITDCTKALDLNPLYLKVVLRRAQAYELTDKLEDALKDFQRALELDPGCHEARAACLRLPDQIQERNEKLKAEMMSKLKDLGNLCLRPFGLSTDNFQFTQDPATGSYSVNFQQNARGNNGK
ncbi:tetratricopeptide repeat protein 1-like [Acanthaster planci]|uniref:Tetratricopeptide repeat protein 1-like n=1 Tax=Acanthaster planci TaxID=133434 RepID=A0A8B7Y2L4_ACAPL|nr:tetratricopeptide repeat protein 1-like [Acanthaster planci]XP_022086546.1 tetratricopeptide repeat protein 1-like [Acanthaster planci]XP_022086548.1 tetratricopeptide repeat protein 1-like [Acanthaster planci]XP_022086549.1 tetratricopeptide repeat protein 1-like [Acanthaster planci]